MDSWKKTEVTETDLMDLMRSFLRQWKRMFACALVFMLLFGGYGLFRNRSSGHTDARQNLSDSMDGSDVTEDPIALTKAQQQKIVVAAALAKETADLEEYLENSILMQIDAYHKPCVTLLYSIEDTEKYAQKKILESYVNFLANGGAVKELKKETYGSWKMKESYLAEMLAVRREADDPDKVILEDTANGMSPELLYVELTGLDMEMAERLASDLQEVLRAYGQTAERITGKHALVLLNEAKGIKYDSRLQLKQHDNQAVLRTNIGNLKTLTDDFDEQQKAAYEKAAGISGESGEEPEVQKPENALKMTGSIAKYFLAGFACGLFLYGCMFAFRYLLLDTVKSVAELKERYRFPVYGSIILKKGTVDDGSRAQILNRIRLACKKQKVSRLCMAAGISCSGWERECLDGLIRQLDDWGIHTVLAENIRGNVPVWDTVTDVGMVLMVYRIGRTTHRMIDEEMEFYLENEVTVLGAMALEDQ